MICIGSRISMMKTGRRRRWSSSFYDNVGSLAHSIGGDDKDSRISSVCKIPNFQQHTYVSVEYCVLHLVSLYCLLGRESMRSTKQDLKAECRVAQC